MTVEDVRKAETVAVGGGAQMPGLEAVVVDVTKERVQDAVNG